MNSLALILSVSSVFFQIRFREQALSEYLDGGDIAFGLFFEVAEDAVDIGGAVVEIVVERGVVEEKAESRIG